MSSNIFAYNIIPTPRVYGLAQIATGRGYASTFSLLQCSHVMRLLKFDDNAPNDANVYVSPTARANDFHLNESTLTAFNGILRNNRTPFPPSRPSPTPGSAMPSVNDSYWFVNFSPCDFFNDSNCTNDTNSTITEDAPKYRYWALLLLIFPLLTVFGNCLVVLSVWREKGLKNVTNYFIVSLAVADLLVAVLVMPPAVYVEVVTLWGLGGVLCDAWVASDVLGCTASILNLTAISVDRFIAVTQPIKYSKHKNAKRFIVMLALAWITSIAIAAPIALGVNYSPRRVATNCIFYNADFIIYSSMGSFYIPSVIMLILYGKILLVLRQRTRRFNAKRRLKTVDKNTLQNVIENAAQTASLTAHIPENKIGNNVNMSTLGCSLSPPTVPDDPSVTMVATTSDTPEDDEVGKAKPSDNTNAHVIPNVNVTNANRLGYIAPSCVEIETQFSICTASSPPEPIFMPTVKKKFAGLSRNGSAKKERSRKTVTKFKFNLRQSKRKKESKASAKREKKATKTLAIVLGVFLVCWVPFFTINIMSAICIRYELFDTYPACSLEGFLFSTFVWLGYMNSFLNPLIYTIFNPEFRKAFQKLLTDPCRKRTR